MSGKVGRVSGKSGGRGTHGSLTKSGKVRSTTPPVEKTTKHGKTIPRRSNHKKWMVRTHRPPEESYGERKRSPYSFLEDETG